MFIDGQPGFSDSVAFTGPYVFDTLVGSTGTATVDSATVLTQADITFANDISGNAAHAQGTIKNITTGESGLIQSPTTGTTLTVLAGDFPTGWTTGNQWQITSEAQRDHGWQIGAAYGAGANLTQAKLADLFFDDKYYDPTTHLQNFYNDGEARDPGVDGTGLSGFGNDITQPLVFMGGAMKAGPYTSSNIPNGHKGWNDPGEFLVQGSGNNKGRGGPFDISTGLIDSSW